MRPQGNYPRRLIVNTVYRSRPQPIWTATVDNHPDLIGYGPAEADAVYDLYCQIDERDSDDQDRWQCETGIRT